MEFSSRLLLYFLHLCLHFTRVRGFVSAWGTQSSSFKLFHLGARFMTEAAAQSPREGCSFHRQCWSLGQTSSTHKHNIPPHAEISHFKIQGFSDFRKQCGPHSICHLTSARVPACAVKQEYSQPGACVGAYTRTPVHTHAHTSSHPCARTPIHAHTCTLTPVHTHAHTRSHPCTRTHAVP